MVVDAVMTGREEEEFVELSASGLFVGFAVIFERDPERDE